MATLRRRDPQRAEGHDSPLPPEIAAGPDPRVWGEARQWLAAGDAWAREHLPVGDRQWRALLPHEVAYATGALGRAHARHGGYVPPWER